MRMAAPLPTLLNVLITCAVALTACNLPNSVTVKPSGVFARPRAWAYRTADPITSTPAHAGDIAYLRTSGSLIALELASGAEKWRVQSPSDTPLSLAPVVAGSAVIVPETGSRIAAFSAATGAFLWRAAPAEGDPLSSARIDALAATARTVLVARHDLSLTAYDAGDGRVVWEHKISDRASQFLAVDRHAVYLALAQTLTAYDPSNGVLLWRREFSGFIGPLLASGSTLYVFDQSSVHLLALNTESRQVLWEAAYQQLAPFQTGCLAESDDRIYVAELKLLAISKADGSMVWASPPTGRLECPVVLGSNVVVRNRDTTLYAFSVATGAEAGVATVQANTPMKAEPDRGPIAASGLLIVPTGSRELIALQP